MNAPVWVAAKRQTCQCCGGGGEQVSIWIRVGRDRTKKTKFAVPRKMVRLPAVHLGIGRLGQPIGVAGAPATKRSR